MTDIYEFLKTRRSSKITALTEPGPSPAQLQDILTIGTRVPDHGKYHPWYLVVLEGDARAEAGKLLRAAYEAENPDAAPAKLDLEAGRFLRAPVVIMVVSRIREGKNAQWEQILSAGAVCYNLSLAANALGFGANWLTEWYAYSPVFKESMGIAPDENIAGFVYIGTAIEKNEERERPDISKIVTFWSDKSSVLNKGEGYGQAGKGMPPKGFC